MRGLGAIESLISWINCGGIQIETVAYTACCPSIAFGDSA
jgi:hypothetical protein